jgi:hypothetical protein
MIVAARHGTEECRRAKKTIHHCRKRIPSGGVPLPPTELLAWGRFASPEQT